MQQPSVIYSCLLCQKMLTALNLHADTLKKKSIYAHFNPEIFHKQTSADLLDIL